jgi:hypothetical protein
MMIIHCRHGQRIAADCDACSARCSRTSRTARSRSSAGYGVDALFVVMAPSFPKVEASGKPGAVSLGNYRTPSQSNETTTNRTELNVKGEISQSEPPTPEVDVWSERSRSK